MVRSDNIKVKFLLFLWTINLQEIAEELKTKKVETKEWPMNVALKKVVKIKKKYHHIKWIFKKVDFDLYSVISWKPFCPHSYFLPFKGARRLISFFKCTNKYPNMDLNPFVSAEMPAIKRIRLPKWMYMEIFVCLFEKCATARSDVLSSNSIRGQKHLISEFFVDHDGNRILIWNTLFLLWSLKSLTSANNLVYLGIRRFWDWYSTGDSLTAWTSDVHHDAFVATWLYMRIFGFDRQHTKLWQFVIVVNNP